LRWSPLLNSVVDTSWRVVGRPGVLEQPGSPLEMVVLAQSAVLSVRENTTLRAALRGPALGSSVAVGK
jgi:hypothetical protein